MKTITSKELELNIDKYSRLAEQEEIMVTDNSGNPLYYIEPYKLKKARDLESIFGVLPEDATCERNV